MVKGKPIKGFPEYTVTSNGKVFRRGKEVKSYDNGCGSPGYRQVKLFKNGKRYTKNVHRLVLGEPSKDVDHKDGNKANNNRKNLQQLSHKDNVKKAFN